MSRSANGQAGLNASSHKFRGKVFKWFLARHREPTPVQERAWPLIADRHHVLIASPTGTGKTLAAFLGVLATLEQEHASGRLGEGIQCIYISPLRALGYDLEKNLNAPLAEIFGESPPIRVELRTGDTTAHSRQRQQQRPPHILLTTPESLCVLLSQPKWVRLLETVRWVIVDEIHALADNKRGVHLALSVERLAALTLQPPQRIGISATIAPLDAVARFLVGTTGVCEVVDAGADKRVVLSVHTPLRKNPYPPAGFTGERLIKELASLVEKHRTTLVFSNTRSGAEATTFWLRERLPALAGQIECHHGSLERDIRREVEDRLKRGELRAVVCSTSLELGIDIGSVDLVVMLAAPKGVSRALQRAGRAGHNIHSVSRGILMATNLMDLVETCATVLLARARKLDEVRVPANPLDVLAQHLVSMGCLRRWPRAEALALIRSCAPFSTLEALDFDAVLDYLAGGGASLRQQYSEVFGKIVLDDDGFETREGKVRREFLQNIGVIPDTGSVRVRDGARMLGSVEEFFIRQLAPGDIFILAGRPVRLDKVAHMEAWVTSAEGATPTVPRWNASKFPLSNRVAEEIGAFRLEIRTHLEAATDSATLSAWVAQRLDCGAANAAVIAQVHELQFQISEIPTGEWLLVEEYFARPDDTAAVADMEMDEEKESAPKRKKPRKKSSRVPDREGRHHYFFHSLIGRSANDALARVAAQRINRLRGGNAVATPHDYGFVLSVTEAQKITAEDLPVLLAPEGFEADLHTSLEQSEMMKYHFRNAAQTGLMVYRHYNDQRKPVRKLAWSAEVIFNVLRNHEPDHVLMREARHDTLRTFVDAEGAQRFLQRRLAAKIRIIDQVPPLSFAMYATKIREALVLEEPWQVQERLYHHWWTRLHEEKSEN